MFPRLATGVRLCSGWTVRETVARLAGELEAAAVPEPDTSASLIVAHLMNENNVEKLSSELASQVIESSKRPLLEAMSACRVSRMPVQYIVKTWDFREIRLAMKPPVFIPRPETEQLVSLVLENCIFRGGGEKLRILEVGCGSGAVCLSLLREAPADTIKVTAVDRSRLACALTMENAVLNDLWRNLTVLHAKVDEDGGVRKMAEDGPEMSAEPKFDMIVSNPPYVLRKDLMNLAPEISVYEDLRALDGGADGLSVIVPILKFASENLEEGGRVLLEVDPCHPLILETELRKQNLGTSLRITEVCKDFCERDRFMVLQKQSKP